MSINPVHDYFEPLPSGSGEQRLTQSTCEVIDFVTVGLAPRESYAVATAGRESVIVVLAGQVDVQAGEQVFEKVGGRTSVFDDLPTAVYVPRDIDVTVTAHGDTEIAVCSATSDAASTIAPYLINSADVATGTWGEGVTERNFRQIISADQASERIFVAEVMVADGRWATYPPHKHEIDAADGSELFQEEMYYYRVDPSHGIGLCALYGGKVEGDTAYVVRDRTVHKMPFGYHTVTAGPGYRVWYLAVFAGNSKAAKPLVDPDHAWYTAAASTAPTPKTHRV